MASAKNKLYGADDRLLCAVCAQHTAINEDMPYCVLCGANSEGMLFAQRKISDMQNGVADLAMGLSQRGVQDASFDLQRALELLDQAKKKLESSKLFKLDQLKRGLTTEL